MSNKKLLLALAISSLASCSNVQNESEIDQTKTQAQTRIYSGYLACYALHPEDKKQCVESLQFSGEKLGFKQFLNNQGLECEAIDDSPNFVEDKQAYLVQCQPSHQYLMRFDYETKEWQLIEEDKTNDR